MDNNKVKILIIGAGPSGLSTLKALKQLEPKQNYQIVCVEKQNNWGGQWNYSQRSTTDQYGEEVHSSMYSQLWTNSPKEVFEFPDYTFKEHFKKSVPSYIPRQKFKEYFMTRFQKFGLKENILFYNVVRNVKYLEGKSIFEVRITDLQKNCDRIQYFNYVTVSTGHYSCPNIPNFKGIQKFKGQVIHCHNVRSFKQFKDKNILVIGGGASSQDVVIQCYKYGAKNIIWSIRGVKKIVHNVKNYPKNIEEFQGFDELNQQQVCFKNGEKRSIDTIILCTGYLHNFPFLEDNLRLKSSNVPWPPNLYKSVVWKNNPQLFYIGMGDYLFAQVFFDIQAYFIRDVVSGKHRLPNLSVQDPGDVRRHQQMIKAKSLQDVLSSQLNYARQLIESTCYPNYNIEGISELFKISLQCRYDDMINYRDKGIFKSVITGQQSCHGKIPWVQVKQAEPWSQNNGRELNQYFEF